MFVLNRRDRRGLEEKFPHQNWPVILGSVVLLNTAYAIFTPSIYQFITTPRSEEEKDCENDQSNSERFWPGLASSETTYAWVLMAYSIPETASMPVAGIMADKVPYTITILFLCAVYAAGGIFYGKAETVWMVIVGRGLMGCGAAFADVTASSYIGEMGTRMDEIRERQGKRPLKYALYIAYSFTMNGTFILTFGITSVMAQFKSVEPYHWPGWFITGLAVVYATVVVLTFSEPRPFQSLKGFLNCKCWTGLKLSINLRSGWKIRLISYVFLVSCGYMIGQVYAILTTLVTPVLSDQFGFSVEYTSYYLAAVSVAFIVASVIQLITKSFKLNNRLLLGVSLMVVLTGVILMGDWQAIGNDSCSNNTNTDTFESCSNSSLHQELCEGRSNSSQCFWNPQSRITGEFCNTCHDACLSEQKAMDFYQFGVGVLLISLASPLGFVYIPAITSDITSVESQGTMLSFVIGSGALARALSPLWFVESYYLSNNHTYISMAVTALCLIILLLSLLLLYKTLAPKPIQVEAPELTPHASVNILASLEPQPPFLDDEVFTAGDHELVYMYETTV